MSSRRGRGENGEKGTGNKKHSWYVQNRQEGVKYSMGNVEAKELICTTNGHKLRRGLLDGRGLPSRGVQRRKNGTIIIA